MPGAPGPFTLHDLLTRGGPAAAEGMLLLERGEVRRDQTFAAGEVTVREVIFSLSLGVDGYMVQRRSLVEEGRERPFLYALFKVEPPGGGVTLQRAWRDDEGAGTFLPSSLEGGILPLLEAPKGWMKMREYRRPPPPMSLSRARVSRR